MGFSLAFILPLALLVFLLGMALCYIWALMPRAGTPEWIHLQDRPAFAMPKRNRLHWSDLFIALAIIGVWTAISFFNLGDRQAPQNFHRFEGEFVVVDLGGERNIGQVWYYTGLNQGSYALYFSNDGEEWHRQGAMTQGHHELFRWLEASITPTNGVRYIRLRGEPLAGRYDAIYLGELAIFDQNGNRLNPMQFRQAWSVLERGSLALFDEQSTVPDRSNFLNSSYFDEIFHARTAYEHVLNMWPYEISHPPLGKLLISTGIHLFGMTPFGWRAVGAFSGALILGIFYLMAKELFGKRTVALCGTILFATSFMHFTQTRIATIDTYAVLFILLQFWFIYRYTSMDHDSTLGQMAPNLLLTGVFFGLGAASKWSALYFAPVIAVLWIMYQVFRRRHYIAMENKPAFTPYFWKTVLLSCVSFLLIPAMIYYLSYIPYASAMEYSLFSRGMFDIVIENQRFMFSYHANLVAEHPFSSHWYEWILNIRPILYYRSVLPDGSISTISAFGNPLLHWGGLFAMIAMPFAFIRRGDARAFFIFFSYLVLILPWVFISRLSFAYHYFPNLIFLSLAIAYTFDHLIRRGRGYYKSVILAVTSVSVALFILFYPALSGRPMSVWYLQNVLRWFGSWTF